MLAVRTLAVTGCPCAGWVFGSAVHGSTLLIFASPHAVARVQRFHLAHLRAAARTVAYPEAPI